MKINSIKPNINSYNSVVSKWKRIKDDSVRFADALIFPENEDPNHVPPEYYLYNYENQNNPKFKTSLKEVIEKYTRWQKNDEKQIGKFVDFFY